LNFLREKQDDGNVKDPLKGDQPVIFHSAQTNLNVSDHFAADVESQALETRRKRLLCPFVLVTPIGHLTARAILPLHTIALPRLRLCFRDRERHNDGVSEFFLIWRIPGVAGNEGLSVPESNCPETWHGAHQSEQQCS